jgi:hypothetical protein
MCDNDELRHIIFWNRGAGTKRAFKGKKVNKIFGKCFR